MELQAWVSGLKTELAHKGQPQAASKIAAAEKIFQIIADYNGQHQLDLGTLEIPVVVKTELQTFKASITPDASPIIIGVVMGAVFAAYLADR
jgi:hypothetical protein